MGRNVSKHLLIAGVASLSVAASAASAGHLPVLKMTDMSSVPSYVQVVGNAQSVLDNAKGFVDEMAREGISYLSNEGLSEDQLRVHFKSLLEKNFDIDKIARFSLGRYWKSASPAQQREYTQLFKKMIVDVYTHRFSEYQGQVLEVRDARTEGNKDIIVQSVLVSNNGSPDIDVEWRVRQVGSRYKVIDVIVEGVSMALTQRSDFASVIQRGGGDLDVLLAHLQK